MSRHIIEVEARVRLIVLDAESLEDAGTKAKAKVVETLSPIDEGVIILGVFGIDHDIAGDVRASQPRIVKTPLGEIKQIPPSVGDGGG